MVFRKNAAMHQRAMWLVGLAFVTGQLFAQENSPSTDGSAESAIEARLMEAARTPEQDFFAAYDAARDAGVPEGKLVQARLIKALVAGDIRGMVGMIEKIEQNRDAFDVGFSPKEQTKYAFVSAGEIDGMLHALKAVRAYQDDDEAAFETHAKAAFWAWPQWAQMFHLAELIQRKRVQEVTQEYASHVTLPLDTSLRDLDGKLVTLGDLLRERKAVLFDFWASWCGPCMRSMPELQERANVLPAQGVAVVAVNTDEETPLDKARKVRDEKSMDLPWLVEQEGRPLSEALFIDSIPRAVLVGTDGKVLFNGHPADEGLVAALNALGADPKNRVRADVKSVIGDPADMLPKDLALPESDH